ncbi:uncharacterized protein PITG_11978 [Phytophthora infestans T30-4]|uniref:Uncharacterized protein n=1 Tax=Phytophthora infestans (strain T30-4) TaxID=403677 RepID=D0NHN7_PHYIT|nr:uncharacterized protein PITG_11978 [Phytophthora infestans T30-4]EEY58962.1 conserved hypothetical protein [Phytophthora infestans T30-4]|eukprot:XP_002901435.1 conserved hypothetical protein [Phytophthora infestans T30-4]
MTIMIGKTVLVSDGSSLLDAEVLVHYLAEFDRPDEWVTRDRIFGPKRLDAMTAWMKSVDVTLVRLNKDVNDLVEHQTNETAQLMALERRKKEAIETKAQLEASVLQDLKRVRVAEETAMARKRLQSAGVAQEEIDAILPVIPHES